MKLSIITVCYNCRDNIHKTLDSVASQESDNYEYIIVDGKSTDGTLDVVNSYTKKINNMIVISEDDQGIYDAMNKGVRHAHGDYVFFLNAGDVFYNSDVISNVTKLFPKGYDIIYGNVLVNDRIERYENYSWFDFIYLGRTICHQAIFAKRQLLLKEPFDLNYKICADRDWLIKMLSRGKKFFYAKELIVAVYDTTGISSVSPLLWKEKLSIIKKYGSWNAYYFFVMKSFLLKLMRAHSF